MEQRIAYFRVSMELLREMLHLPADAVIRGVKDDGMGETMLVFVAHPGLKAVECVGQTPLALQYPEANPVFHKNEPVSFMGSGQEQDHAAGT